MIAFLQSAGAVLLVILLFNLMIFVHELGHFLAAKWRGAHVDRFQICFGKPIWKKKIRGVEWGIGWIPAGGFVSLPQMADMQAIEGAAHVDKAELKPLKPLDKIIIAAAGPLFSLLLAYVFAVVVFFAGKPANDIGTTIGVVLPGSPAAEAGLLPGDTITAIDGRKVDKWFGDMEGVIDLIALAEHADVTVSIDRMDEDGKPVHLDIRTKAPVPERSFFGHNAPRDIGIRPIGNTTKVGDVIARSPAARAGIHEGQQVIALNGRKLYTGDAVARTAAEGEPLQLTLLNPDGSTQDATITPEIPDNWKDKKGAIPIIGINWQLEQRAPRYDHPSPHEQVGTGFRFIFDTVSKLFAKDSAVGIGDLSSPIGIGNTMFQMLSTKDGWHLVLWFSVVLNVNLALLNILPLPVVDGGHVVLGFAEMIRRKPVGAKFLNWVFSIFILLLIAFFLFITIKDIGALFSGKEEPLPYPPAFAPKAE